MPGKYVVHAFSRDAGDAVAGSSKLFECAIEFDAELARRCRCVWRPESFVPVRRRG